MDYVILSVTTTILPNITTLTDASGSKAVCIKYLKRIVGSVIGATWSVVLLWNRLNGWGISLITYAIIGPMMLMIVTGRMRPVEIIKSVGAMYVVTFVLAGAIYAIYYYTSVGYYIHNIIFNSKETAELWILPVGVIIANALIRGLVAILLERRSKRNLLCIAIIENNDKEVKLPAFYDTGNSLKDPIYGQWVHIVLADCVKELIGGQNSYHLIPYTSIGNENGLIPVVRMEKLKIINGKEVVILEKQLFALYAGRFSKNTPYRVILNPNVGVDSIFV